MTDPEMTEDVHDDGGDEEIITCWCGERGTYDELFDESGLADGCGGSGTIDCHCGGDFCVCHHHGSVECDGCEDCYAGRDDGDDYDSDDYCDADVDCDYDDDEDDWPADDY